MEIFQTIWTALTTPNEGLISIFSILLIPIETIVTMLFFLTILNVKHTNKQILLYFFIMTIWAILSNLFIPKQIVVFINMIIPILLIMFIFHLSLLKAIIAEMLPTIVVVLLEAISSKLLNICFQVALEQATLIPIYRISIATSIYLIIYVLYIISKHLNFSIDVFDNIDIKSKQIIFINFILVALSISTQFYIIGFYNDVLPVFIVFLSMFSLIIYFILSIFTLTRTTQLQIANENLEEAQLYNKSLKILHDNVRGFKHDFGNIVQSIGGYVGTNDMGGLKTYYSQLLDDCQKVNNLYTLSPDVINNPAIYSLLTSKYHKADELGIKIHLEVFLNLNELNMQIYEFTRILGILMDNAIEAANECEEKIINVEIRKDFKVNRQLLLVENTYKEKDIDLDKIFEKGYSTKPDNTGLGLWEIRQILKRSKNLNLYTTKDDKYFKQQLEMYNK